MFLKKLLDPETQHPDDPEYSYMKLTDNLVDRNSTVLRSQVTFEVIYSAGTFPRELEFSAFHPVEEAPKVYEDWELETVKTRYL